jgi:hypothetical protein
MPIETILPDATTTPNPAWSGAPHTLLSDQGTNNTTCAGANTGNSFIVSFGNLTSDIASINSITFGVNGNTGAPRGVTAVCAFDLLNDSDSSYSYSENKSFTDATGGTEQAGTERTTSDGSTAWTESDVNGFRMKVVFSSITNASSTINLDFLKIDVDYNAPAAAIAPTYDTTINNIHVTSGNIDVTSGNIFI